MKKIFFTSIFLGLLSQGFSQKLTPVDDKSTIKFSIKNFGMNTSGFFKGLKGSIVFDPLHLDKASFEITADANTINTDITARDNHLRKVEYFDILKYPLISFLSTKIIQGSSVNEYNITGKLTMKGVTRELTFPFKAIPGNSGFNFEGNFTLNRRDFGVGGNSFSLSDHLTVTLSVFATQ